MSGDKPKLVVLHVTDVIMHIHHHENSDMVTTNYKIEAKSDDDNSTLVTIVTNDEELATMAADKKAIRILLR